jgi:uncharacterized protein
MKFELDSANSALLVRAYGPDFVTVADQRYHTPILLTPQSISTESLPARFHALELEHFLSLNRRGVEIIVVGSGSQQVFLTDSLTNALSSRRIGTEVMATR